MWFYQFQKQRTHHKDLREVAPEYCDMTNDSEKLEGYYYPGSLVIHKHDAENYYLITGNQEWIHDNIEFLEALLFIYGIEEGCITFGPED